MYKSAAQLWQPDVNWASNLSQAKADLSTDLSMHVLYQLSRKLSCWVKSQAPLKGTHSRTCKLMSSHFHKKASLLSQYRTTLQKEKTTDTDSCTTVRLSSRQGNCLQQQQQQQHLSSPAYWAIRNSTLLLTAGKAFICMRQVNQCISKRLSQVPFNNHRKLRNKKVQNGFCSSKH